MESAHDDALELSAQAGKLEAYRGWTPLAYIGVVALLGALSYIFIVGEVKRIEL